jgi:phage terminase large subunit
MIELTNIAQTVLNPVGRIIAQQGGTSSGKTYNVMIGLVAKALTEQSKGLYIILGPSLPMLKRGAMNDLEMFLDSEGKAIRYKKNVAESSFTFGKTKMLFIGADAKLGQAPKSKVVFVDESNYIGYETFKKFHDRTNLTILAWNPSQQYWFHENLLPYKDQESDGYECYVKRYISNYTHNKHLTKTRIQDIERYKEIDPEYYKVYGLGLTGVIQGQIYKRVKHIDKLPDGLTWNQLKWQGYGMDFGGGPDPTTVVEAGEHGRDLYARTLLYDYGLETNELTQKMVYKDVSKNIVIYADHEPMTQRTIGAAGFKITNAFKGAGSIKDGIKALNTYDTIYIVNSPEMYKETQKYVINPNNGNPIDKDNHALDALRYWYAGNIGLTARII